MRAPSLGCMVYRLDEKKCMNRQKAPQEPSPLLLIEA
jgi:hypothetical protein